MTVEAFGNVFPPQAGADGFSSMMSIPVQPGATTRSSAVSGLLPWSWTGNLDPATAHFTLRMTGAVTTSPCPFQTAGWPCACRCCRGSCPA